MRRPICGAVLVIAGLSVTCAWAEDAAKWHDRSGTAGGGWTMDSGVGGWKQNSTTKTQNNTSSGIGSSGTTAEAFGRTKAFTSAAAGGVSSSTTNETASKAAAGAISSTTTLLGPGLSPVRALLNGSDCVFVGQDTPSGNRWRPGCK